MAKAKTKNRFIAITSLILVTAVVRGTREEIAAKVESLAPEFYEIIPLTLEEIFISEMEERGYDYTKVVF